MDVHCDALLDSIHDTDFGRANIVQKVAYYGHFMAIPLNRPSDKSSDIIFLAMD
jgi:hypothetical protein